MSRRFTLLALIVCLSLVLTIPTFSSAAAPQLQQGVPSVSLAGSFAITAPAVGTEWLPTSRVYVRWTHAGQVGQHVKISLYRGSQFASELVTSLPVTEGENSFSWMVPADIVQAQNYTIQVQSVERTDIKATSAPFTIRGKMHIVEPDANTQWAPGTNQVIKVLHHGLKGQNIKLILLENGAAISTIVSSISASTTGTQTLAAWHIPSSQSESNNRIYVIQAQSVEYPFVTATSENFALRGKITITAPFEGKHIANGGTLVIDGNVVGCTSGITIILHQDGNGTIYKSFDSVTTGSFHREIVLSGLNPGICTLGVISVAAPYNSAYIWKLFCD